MKNVLCAMWQPQASLLGEIYDFGSSHNWQIELCGRRLPPVLSQHGDLYVPVSFGHQASLPRPQTMPATGEVCRLPSQSRFARQLPRGGSQVHARQWRKTLR